MTPTMTEEEAIAARAQYNTEFNRRYGSDTDCDGYCASEECVCGDRIDMGYEGVDAGSLSKE